MLEHFERVLRSGISKPEGQIGDMELLTEREVDEQVRESNERSEYERGRLVHELIREQVEISGETIAVSEDEVQVSYGELERRTNQLARHLIEKGVGPEVIVGISMEASIEMVIGMLGVVKAGGAYLPLDPELPWERKREMIRESRCGLILTRGERRRTEEGMEVEEIRVDEERRYEGYSEEEIGRRADEQNLAYVMYTSGSTGSPKGVGVTHESLNWLMRNLGEAEIKRGDVVGQVASPSFDAVVYEVWGGLVGGGRVELIKREVALSAKELRREIEGKGVSVMYLTSALFEQLAREEAECLRGVRLAIVGGESLNERWAKEVVNRGGVGKLVHEYGPTETTVFTSFEEVERGGGGGRRRVGIGRRLNGARVRVMDERMRLVPEGVRGEMYIGGECLARCYIGKRKETAERFVPDPYSEEEGARLYRSGDEVRQKRGGKLEFIGRRDRQVKVRGYRIELEEIEIALRQHPSIVEAVAIVRGESPAGNHIVAYLRIDEDSAPSLAEIRAFIRMKLPEYMLPSAMVILDEFPLTRNGKLDRKALPAPDAARTELGHSYSPPRTPLEEKLVSIWREILGISNIGILDNFFELGGHSLSAMQLVSRVRDAFQVELPLRTLFQNPTPVGLATAVVQYQAELTERDEIIGILAELEQLPESLASPVINNNC
jgi:amino acid adenylation domain-containing protein